MKNPRRRTCSALCTAYGGGFLFSKSKYVCPRIIKRKFRFFQRIYGAFDGKIILNETIMLSAICSAALCGEKECKMKRLSLVLAALSVIFAISINAAGWYCKHEKDGKIPPCPTEFSYLAEYGGVYINKTAAEKGDKVVYLTFDAGYENGNVEKILDVLGEKKVCGAFFILENLIKRNPELVRRMAKEGHTVCNHTAHHRNMSNVSSKEEFAEELEELEKCASDELGIEISKFYRPPEGEISRDSLRYASELGYTTVMWSFAYADWDNARQMSAEKAKRKIIDSVHCGEIMLLHPTSATNAEILGDVITELAGEGYRFGSLDELLSPKEG